MTDIHNYSFFGKSAGLTLRSNAKKEPYMMITCIKDKGNGSWEKPSKGEGKSIKLSLEEMACIADILSKHEKEWSTYHAYKENGTQISFKWKDDTFKELFISIGEYKRMLKPPDVRIMQLLLDHLLTEKIEWATSGTYEKKAKSNGEISPPLKPIKVLVKEEGPPAPKQSPAPKKVGTLEKEQTNIHGEISGATDKALNIRFFGNNEVWIPKSTIHNAYSEESKGDQQFLIDTWVLRKNQVVS